MSVKDLLKQISSAASGKELKEIISIGISKATEAASMGIDKQKGTSVNVERKKANAAAMEVLERVGTDHTKLTEADKAALRKYSGIGGTDTVKDNGDGKGHIHEYYTPTPIAEGIWDGLEAMGFGGGNSLEPSAGAGVFQETKPKNAIMTAAEIDETSSQVNGLLHPEDMVLNQPFEMLAQSHEDNSFDSCVGNVPFGSTRGDTAKYDLDPASKEIDSLHGYFVVRTIDKVKPNGLIGLVVPNGIVSGSKYKKIRQRISMKAEFLGAHRLPSGVFTNSGTSTSTDIIFLRKHSEELAEQVANLPSKTLKDTNVIWKPFIDGKWFTTSQGKRFLHGEEEQGYRTTVKNTGELSNEALKKKLSHKFESRIDLDALSLAEPIAVPYIEGDRKVINGRDMEFNGITWDVIKPTGYDGTLDADKYGAASAQELHQQLTPLANANSFTYEQLKAITEDMPWLIKGELAVYMELASTVDAKYREQVVRGCIIGQQISMLHAANITAGDEITEAANKVKAEIAKYGVIANVGKLKTLSGKGAGAWNNFISGMDKDGNLSDFLSGKLDKGDVIDIDRTNASEVISYLYSVKDLSPVTFDEFLEMYEGTELTLEELAKYENVAITPDGDLSPLDRATSGNIVDTKNNLLIAMGSTTSTAIIDNMQRQLNEIERKRVHTPIDAISTTMNAKWIPRDLVTEFLEDNGYDFTYSRVEVDDEGNQFENTEYTGKFGEFLGYRKHDGLKRNAKSNTQFEQQLENYLNGQNIRTSGAKDVKGKDGLTPSQRVATYKAKMKQLEENFGIWLREHDRAEEITELYNDTFNGHINIEHSGAPLGLENTSGNMENFDYQCSEIRRLSEAGTGICGFGTGLGKTSTALGLVAYNTQIGRAKRTVLVVPKSVMENWYHESHAFFSEAMFNQSLFIGLEPIRDKETGEIEQEAIMDGDEPKLNPITGKPIYRAKLKEIKGKKNNELLSSIPHSNYKFVIMSKEQFGKISLRPHSLTEHVDQMVEQGLLRGSDNKYKAVVKNHKDAMKNEKYREKYMNDGTSKNGDIPYFEDMGFDNIIVDEGHNYRNSYSAGREASMIQYLPTAPSAQTALDMAVKSQYLKRQYNGRGTVMLTATPTVNSPTDVFNMLSHIMSPDDWAEYGIVDVDDFVRVFGETAPEEIEKLSGEIETKDALVGFKNLSGLRGIFHKYVNLKDATDIKDSVIIPDVIDVQQECEMTDEQSTIYEELRDRAEALVDPNSDEAIAIEAMGGKVDTTFGIIRDMDRVTTDIDLYKRQMTFVLPIADKDKVAQLVADLPETIETTKEAVDPDTGKKEKITITHFHNAKMSVKGDAYVLVVQEKFEEDVTKRLEQFGIDESTVSHPVTPKYAKLIENIKNGLETGKQIIFTEEKTQHNKLKRILVNSLGLDPSTVGIINADAVNKKGKSSEEDQQGSLEEIAINYNSGKLQVLICNKKAEVGINLHIGTATIHHLTLPWTPASIKQRNGRGARVGAPQKSIDAIYYVGKGSFDDFRLKSLKRKADWMDKLFNGTEDSVENADASDAEENNMLLAKNPEELAARIAAAKKKKADELQAAMDVRNKIDLNNFIKASHDLKLDAETIKGKALQADHAVTNAEKQLEEQLIRLADANEREATAKANDNLASWQVSRIEREVREAKQTISSIRKRIPTLRKDRLAASNKVKRIEKAEKQVKQLRPNVEAGIKSGSIDASMDVLVNATDYVLDNGKAYKIGQLRTYIVKEIVKILSMDFDSKTASIERVYSESSWSTIGEVKADIPLSTLGAEQSYTPSELDAMNSIRGKQDVTEIASKLDKEQFYKYLKSGDLELGSRDYLATHQTDGFTIVGRSDAKDYTDGEIVYPTSKDETLQKRLAEWMINNRDKAKSYSEHSQFFKAILGSDWEEAYEQYGNVAPDAWINNWAMSNLAEWRKTEDGITTSEGNLSDDIEKHGIVRTGDFRAYALNHIPTTYSNLSDFRSAVWDAESAYRKDIRDKRVQIANEKVLPLHAAFKRANVGGEDQLKRIEWLKAQIKETSSRKMLTEAAESELYNGFEGADAYQGAVLADLCALIQDPMSADNLTIGDKNKADSYRAAIDKKADQYYDNMGLFDNPDNGDNQERIEALTDADKARELRERDRLEKEASEAEEIAKNTTSNGSISITINKHLIDKGRRYRFEPEQAWAIHDTDGKNGKLFETKETLKSLYGAKYGNKVSSEFNASYWFIPRSAIELSKLKELLGMN